MGHVTALICTVSSVPSATADTRSTIRLTHSHRERFPTGASCRPIQDLSDKKTQYSHGHIYRQLVKAHASPEQCRHTRVCRLS
jgi:hypothetical protein